MKSFDGRTYSISDFLEWDNNNQLELSPKFQRRSVWSDKAKSYSMDTIIRGKPIPKLFIRQKLNTATQQSIREVVDGQQRLRTILSFLKDGFQISKKHNKDYGGLYYSQLDEDIQKHILTYELSADLLVNMPDSEVLDVFGRLNSYAIVLNEQEKINAKCFGPFKTLADKIGHHYVEFWTQNKILTEAKIVRMAEVTLVADLLIAMIEGIKSSKQIKVFYTEYEKEFEHDTDDLEEKFHRTMTDIQNVFENSLKTTEFRRIHLFYSVFTCIYHLRWGLPNLQTTTFGNQEHWNFSRISNSILPVNEIFNVEDKKSLDDKQAQFLEDSRRATTDATVRTRRTKYLVDLITEN